MNVIERMREDWNRRAREDANYYVAFARQKQSEEEFLATGAEIVARLESEFFRLPPAPLEARRALEIGCGPGRLMIPMSKHFGEIHGVDISEEMAVLARQNLARVQNAHLHVNSGSDLSMFNDCYFDFIYSWVVFQHIPSKEIVLSYLREAQRVLKPGGILACQLRGVSPIEPELRRGSETWTGCWFAAEEIVRFASAQAFPLVSISGIETQYTFTVFRRAEGPRLETPLQRAVVKGVTASSGGERSIPARGRNAAVSLWIDGFPKDGNLAEFPVLFGDKLQTGCFLSPVSESGGCQLNAALPKSMGLGIVPVRLTYRGAPIGDAHEIMVKPAPPWQPKILRVTDRLNLLSRNRIENDGIKVMIEDVEDVEHVAFRVGSRRAGFVLVDCEDPITSTYNFGFPVPHGTRKGANRLIVRVGHRELDPVEIEIL
ncbi:MAG TPA: class I SAM-dependent methyltransferase [Bryobacteraceae bacterium]|jgi:SAM-dependent methyltransferase|nr:class I SAM-dependent methyltransferase [Bryobacteraceae bacterium]